MSTSLKVLNDAGETIKGILADAAKWKDVDPEQVDSLTGAIVSALANRKLLAPEIVEKMPFPADAWITGKNALDPTEDITGRFHGLTGVRRNLQVFGRSGPRLIEPGTARVATSKEIRNGGE